MKVTYKGDYGLKAMLSLALHYNKGVLPIQELAKEGDIPFKFLEQILLTLKNGGFVGSKRGVDGGYFLARPPETITVGEVIRFIEGPIEPVTCANKESYEKCKDFSYCVFKDIWNQVYTATSLVVDTVTFAELVRRVENRKNNYVSSSYSI
ncbi:MAG: transcriptional regulator [Candidatus Omnitrophica bacterium CG22_combo_CG10-13_8_21_14_all_43_16]|nr:MAG: transcriptional regulator [Candidatus Omnitrophica bacterium CG22_combo_CG10-13_8_21_14_all_43_16]